MSQESGAPSAGKSTVEEVEMCRVRGGKPHCKELRQLLEVEGTRSEEEVKGVKGEGKGRRKGSEAYYVTTKRSIDEDRVRKDRHP